MPDPPKPSRRSTSATPADFPVQTPPQQLPGADFSYTVEVVATINLALGKLTEAVDNLKDQTKEQGRELKSISKDIHAAKVAGGLIAVGTAVLGWFIHEAIQYLSSHPVK